MLTLTVSAVRTCVNTKQPGANQGGECLARFGQQVNHPEEQRWGGLLTTIDDKVLVHEIGNNKFQELARPLCKHSVTKKEGKRRHVAVYVM